jgi:hypothetical protein
MHETNDDQVRPLHEAGQAVEQSASRDSTNNAQAEDALRETVKWYRTLFDTIDAGFCIIEFLDGPPGPLSDYVHIATNPASGC